MSVSTHYDVIIVGAGPAGCAAAVQLHRAGLQVLVIEAHQVTPRKICGEFLCYEGAETLKKMGLGSLLDGDWARPSQGVKIVSNTHRFVSGVFPQVKHQEPGGFCLNRGIFDDRLIQHALSLGIAFKRGLRVDSLIKQPTGWQVITDTHLTYTCDLIIGADGFRSVVARQLGLTKTNPKKRFALRCFLPTRHTNEHLIEMHLLEDGNYIGIDVVEDNLVNFSIVANADVLRRYGGAEGVIRHYYKTHPLLQANIILPDPLPKIEAMSPVSHLVKDCIADNAVLIGDAGGFIEPLTGEGMTIAFWTATALSQQLALCKTRNEWAKRNHYLQAFKRQKQRHYFQKATLYRFLYWFITKEKAIEVAANFLNKRQACVEAFAGVINNTYSPVKGLAGLILAAFTHLS